MRVNNELFNDGRQRRFVVILDIHDRRNEERDDGHEDENRAAEDEPETDSELVGDGTGDEQAERHHRCCARAEEREDPSLFIGSDGGLQNRHQGTVGKHLHKAYDEVGSEQDVEPVRWHKPGHDASDTDADHAA